MKKFNKVLSLLMVYLFAMALIPSSLVSTIAKAEGLPKYLETQEGYLRQKYQYKDISIINQDTSEADRYGTELFKVQNGKKEKIEFNESFNVVGAKEIELEQKGKIIDVENGQTIGETKAIEAKVKEVVSQNIGKNIELSAIRQVSDRNDNKWFSMYLYNEGKYNEAFITKNQKFVKWTSQNDSQLVKTVNKDGMFVLETSYNETTKCKEFSFSNITNDGQINKYAIERNGRLSEYSIVTNIYENNGIVTMKYVIPAHLGIDEYIVCVKQFKLKNNVLVFDKDIIGANAMDEKYNPEIGISQDIKGNVWLVKNGYVSKVVDGNLINVYEVNERMNEINVYDENHMIVNYSEEDIYYDQNNTIINTNRRSKEITGKYTIINNSSNKTEEKPNAEDNKGTEKVKPDVNDNKKTEEVKTSANDPKEDTKHEVKPADDKGVQTVVVNKLNKKDDVNVLEVTLDTKTKEAVVEIDDIATIKDGKGSLAVKMGNTTINLPFEAIDKSLLVDGAKVLLKHKVEDNSEIVKDLKGIKKVYNFDLIVKAGEKETSIHNFKGGVAEIAINLSDEELKGLDKDKLAVFYYNETTKSFELMETKVEGNKVTFKTPHFSKYVIAEKETNNLPKTGSNVNTRNLMLAAGVLLIAGAFLVTRRKQQA